MARIDDAYRHMRDSTKKKFEKLNRTMRKHPDRF
jgi:hypothetical protein